MPKDYKRAAILASVLLIAAAFWVFAGIWMHSADRFENWSGMLVSGGLLIAFSSMLALGLLLPARRLWNWGLIGGALLAFLAVNGLDWLYVLGAAIAALLWHWAARRSAREMVERRTIRISSILVHAMPRIMLGSYILLSFAFYLTPASQGVTMEDAVMTFRQQLDRTYDTVLQSELAKLPPSQRGQVRDQVSGQLVQTFEKALGYRFCLTEKACMPAILDLLPPLYAFLFFLLIWSFGFIFRELAVALGAGLFRAMRSFRIVSIVQEDAKVEVLKM